MSITKELARCIVKVKFGDLSPNLVKLTKQVLLEEIGRAFHGTLTDQAKLLAKYIKEIGGKPEATLLSDGTRAPAINAAGVNAFAADMSYCATGYRHRWNPASAIIFSSLAMAERQKASGRELVNSIVISSDITNRIIDATRPSSSYKSRYYSCSHYAFGAAIAAAKILGLNEDALCDAIGISAYTAPLANVNLWLKFRPQSQAKGDSYWQCEAGIEAAMLAEKGFMGPQGVLDGKEWGFWASVSDRCNWKRLTHRLGEEFYFGKYPTQANAQRSMRQKDLKAKFSNMASRVISNKQIERILDIIDHLEEIDNITELARYFTELK